ncbi:hypothetical protein B0H12DRAFT_30132 [Mycena haematopus]|nr:hypothetical protein B0H12DRAFT_30132 [Mycena haematopus]
MRASSTCPPIPPQFRTDSPYIPEIEGEHRKLLRMAVACSTSTLSSWSHFTLAFGIWVPLLVGTRQLKLAHRFRVFLHRLGRKSHPRDRMAVIHPSYRILH